MSPACRRTALPSVSLFRDVLLNVCLIESLTLNSANGAVTHA